MSCYLRHLRTQLEQAGIEPGRQDRKALDRFLHGYVGVPYKDCSSVWKRIKETVLADETSQTKLVAALAVRSVELRKRSVQ